MITFLKHNQISTPNATCIESRMNIHSAHAVSLLSIKSPTTMTWSQFL